MTDLRAPDYWSWLLINIRNVKGWNQSQLAQELNVSRDTVSRWEQEIKHPSADNQIRIGELATTLNIATVFGISQVVDKCSVPMFLMDKNAVVIAASKSSGMISGKTVADQTPEADMKDYKRFLLKIANKGFWRGAGNSFECKLRIGRKHQTALIQSVGIRGHIFGLVQKL